MRVDSVLSTSFPRNAMSSSEFCNNILVLHCCSNTKYPSQAQPGYDPRKKIGNVITILQERIAYASFPKHLSIDEGTVPFKGQICFKVYKPYKPVKYGMKSFKLCDFSMGYYLKFSLYVGKTIEEFK